MSISDLNKITDAPDDSLTIVIPTKSRQAQLETLLRYFQASGTKYKILVLYSGLPHKDLAESYAKLNISVMVFEPDITLHKKLKAGLDTVKTPLVAMCPDDDLILLEGIKKSGGYLIQNPEYSACHGYYSLFSELNNIVNLFSIHWFAPSIDSDNPLERFSHLFRRYQAICWAVFKTEIMQEVCAAFFENITLVWQEYIWSSIPIIKGKVKRLPMIYCLRRIDSFELDGHPTFAMLESPSKFFSEYVLYREKIGNLVAPVVPISKTDLARALDLSYATHLATHIKPSMFNFFTDQVISNPMTSIYNSQTANAISPPLPDTSQGWINEKVFRGTTYRIFPEFTCPQPQSEFNLPLDFLNHLLENISNYFEA